jgi:hypothetical protein
MLLLVFAAVLVSTWLLTSRLCLPVRVDSLQLDTMSHQWMLEQRRSGSGLSCDR